MLENADIMGSFRNTWQMWFLQVPLSLLYFIYIFSAHHYQSLYLKEK